MKISTLLLLCTVFITSSCVPTLIGAVAYSGVKSDQEKQRFMDSLRQTNLDRESKGLKPLDWCDEAYRFDRSWAMKDKECKKRKTAEEKKIKEETKE